MKLNTIVLAITTLLCSQAWAAERFATPEAAGEAVYQALQKNDAAALAQIFGPEAKTLTHAGETDNRAQFKVFTERYTEQHRWVGQGETRKLEIGHDGWPFAVPLQAIGGGWEFDILAGYDELLLRRVGFNELSTIASMRAYVTAQQEYYQLAPLGSSQYAQRIASQPGKKDGLYWASTADKPSPLGDLFAQAASSNAKPFNGYLYQPLTRQGDQAAGGAKNYMQHGKMSGGFALLAYPAKYGLTGITSFIVNQDGVVYESDLGPNTSSKAKTIKAFNPDAQWRALK